ncbi:N,N'-diacetylchitobiose transport system permease protein [Catenulispora sp. EB89]|uniref:carbohydrate ABC transporter permease n=1 Tax=Catenulispora sp. EB89 TaxID=3156257 RepID=UPI003514AB89
MTAVVGKAVGPLEPPPTLGDERPPKRRRFESTPYFLVIPTLLVIVVTLGIPLYKIVVLAFQHQTKRELYTNKPGDWVGFQNFSDVLGSADFWSVVERTFVVCAVLVVLSMAIALLLSLMMNQLSRWVRTPLMALLLFVWAIPQIVAVELFVWFTDPNFGVINYMLDKLGFHGFKTHDWFVDPVQGWIVIIALVVWQALPFLTVTLTAGMSMVPKELGEAARMDGANPFQVFRTVTYPTIKPLLIIATSLSVIWDFQLFNQVFVIRQTKPEPDYQVLSVFSYTQAFGHSDYGLGAAISILTILAMLGMMIFYVRQMLRIGDAD